MNTYLKPIFVDSVHEYNYEEIVTDKGVLHNLYHSNNDCWASHVRGELKLSVLDTGNGFVFNQKIKKELDYHDAFCLSIILKKLSFNDHIIEIGGQLAPL